MAHNVFLTCCFTKQELYTIIYKSMDWFFKFEKENKENEFYESLCDVISAIEKKLPGRIPMYKMRIFGDTSSAQLYFHCPDAGWKCMSDAREHYGLTKIMVGGSGAEGEPWLKS